MACPCSLYFFQQVFVVLFEIRVLGVERRGGAVFAKGPLKVAFLLQRNAEAVMPDWVFGFQAEGRAVLGQRSSQAALFFRVQSEDLMRRGVVLGLPCLPEVFFNGSLLVACL